MPYTNNSAFQPQRPCFFRDDVYLWLYVAESDEDGFPGNWGQITLGDEPRT